jgi:Kef-type K+ transport systems, membrane components
MSEEVNLVNDLALIFISAGLFTLISKALKQPLILGYIVAGFLVGPHMGLFPSITNIETVNEWSEIGIIFLLFALGLEFSFKKLIKVGASALITAVTKCIGMFLVGLVIGSILKFTTMESIFLGGLLSMSSTTIIIKVYDEMGLKNKHYSTLIFGSLVFEDLIAILLLVLLSTLAVSNKFAGGELLMGIGKLVFFMILWFLVGIYVIPTLLKKARKIMSDEILLIVAIGLCFGMVAVASYVGFSSALGAFVMGSILAETIEGERIEHLLGGIKDIFGAVFFVSVGMMVDPAVIAENWLPILVITVFAMLGILIFSTSGALISGQGIDTAVHAGFSLAQLGEFAFIIAGLGCSLGVMRDFIYPVIIAVSVITTFTTPYMIKAADPVSDWLQKKLPAKIVKKLTPSTETLKSDSIAEKSEWRKFLKVYFIRIVLYGVILLAIALGSDMYLGKLISKVIPSVSENAANFIQLGITLLVMLPFLFGIAISNRGLTQPANKLVKENSSNKWFINALIIFRFLIATGFIMAVIVNHVDLAGWAVLVIVALIAALFFLCRRYLKHMSFLEDNFFKNLNEKEEMEAAAKPITTSVSRMLAGYDVHLETVEIAYESDLVGKPIRKLPLRKSHDINIVKIQRGAKSFVIPEGNEIIYPKDLITVVGTSENIAKFKGAMEAENFNQQEETNVKEFDVEKVTITKGSYLDGKSLRETKMRSYGCMVISILHGEKFITTPEADFIFSEGDIIWLAGEKKSCEFFK